MVSIMEAHQQPSVSREELVQICRKIDLLVVPLPSQLDSFVSDLRKTHDNGGAFVLAFDFGQNDIFDFYASRNQLADVKIKESGNLTILDALLTHKAIRDVAPELKIPDSLDESSGFSLTNSFYLDGTFASLLHQGGAYWKAAGDGRREKELALSVCDAMFGLRYAEVGVYSSNRRWTRWFHGVAWDISVVVIDKRIRRLWLLFVTDTD
jgi:hypothetical protein